MYIFTFLFLMSVSFFSADSTIGRLKIPDLSDSQIIGSAVGVRPFRVSGPRIEKEYMSNHLIIHSYGYGGSGITLSWGAAQEAIMLLEEELINNAELAQETSIAVLGAGVIGLTLAYDLLAKGFEVHLYAKDFSPNLTSNVAAGIWSPPAIKDSYSNELQEKLTRMLDVSCKRFMQSVNRENPEFAGIRFVDHYTLETAYDSATEFFDHDMQQAPVEIYFDNGLIKKGSHEPLLNIENNLFMHDLFDKVKTCGATIIQKTFTSTDEIVALPEKIILNCTSMGSKELFSDSDFIPVRGHLLYLKPQEGINYHIYTPGQSNYWFTISPWNDRLIVGGIFEEGKDEQIIDLSILELLITNARTILAQ
jgi:D-amino-acid oxidase